MNKLRNVTILLCISTISLCQAGRLARTMKERYSNCLAKRIEMVKSDYAPILASYQELIKAMPAEYSFYLAQLKSRIAKKSNKIDFLSIKAWLVGTARAL